MKKAICVMFAIVMAGAIMCFFTLKSEETQPIQKYSESPVKPPQVSRPEKKAESDILADIKKAQSLLEKQEAGFLIQEKAVKGKKIKKWEVKDFSVLMAVQHSDKRIQIISVDPKAKKSEPPEYIIDWSRTNGVNTDFTIVHPEGCVVLAIKRVVRDENAEDLFKEVVYTPYSPRIDCQILREAGLTYLKKIIQMARADLRQVSSKVHPERSVAETTTEDLALVLAIIEHIDPNRLKNEKIEQLMNEVLVIIGANQGVAYRYSVSKANARGLFQFIPQTYAKI